MRAFVGVMMVGLLAATVSVQGQEMRWQPVDDANGGPSGPATIIDNSATPGVPSRIIVDAVAGGSTVYIELWMSGWGALSPGVTGIKGYGARLDYSGYLAGSGAEIYPVGWDATCSIAGTPCHNAADDCPGGESCDNSNQAAVEAAAGVNSASIFNPANHPRYVFHGYTGQVSSPVQNRLGMDFLFGVLTSNGDPAGFADPGNVDLYGGHLNLVIPESAAGLYEVRFNPNLETVLTDQFGANISSDSGLTLTPAVIEVPAGRCCFNIGLGATECVVQTALTCATMPGETLFTAGESTCADPGPGDLVDCPNCLGPEHCADPRGAAANAACTQDECLPDKTCA